MPVQPCLLYLHWTSCLTHNLHYAPVKPLLSEQLPASNHDSVYSALLNLHALNVVCVDYRVRVVAFDQRGHGCSHTTQDEDLSADMLVQVQLHASHPGCVV